MEKRRHTEETIAEVCAAYKNGVKIGQISEVMSLPTATIYNMLERNGLYKKKAKAQSLDKCPHCGANGHNSGARFCYKCGADIRSPLDIAIEKIGTLGKYMVGHPEADAGISLLNEISGLLRSVKK